MPRSLFGACEAFLGGIEQDECAFYVVNAERQNDVAVLGGVDESVKRSGEVSMLGAQACIGADVCECEKVCALWV